MAPGAPGLQNTAPGGAVSGFEKFGTRGWFEPANRAGAVTDGLPRRP